MKKIQKITALFLCLLMMIPSQAMAASGNAVLDLTGRQGVESEMETQASIETEVQTEVQTDAETEAQTEVQTDAETEEQTDAETETEGQNGAETEVQTDIETETQTEAQTEAQTGEEAKPDEETDDRIDETLPLEPVDPPSGDEHIRETLPLEPLDGEESLWDGSTEIYWNPGGSLPPEVLATGSNAEPGESASPSVATASNREEGGSRRAGMSPENPARSLEAALKQADWLENVQDVDRSDITIYAMNPMEVPEGKKVVLNGKNTRIVSWPGRAYQNDTVFYINGGQLTLSNVVLESGNGSGAEEAELVYVAGGTLQMGKGVSMYGRIVMDYRMRGAVATASNSSYRADGGAGAWKEPVIELIDGFEGTEGSYLIELRDNGRAGAFTLVRTLYADEMSGDEFAGFFRLADSAAENWSLVPSSEGAATVRDNGMKEAAKYRRTRRSASAENPVMGAGAIMTRKTLTAAKAGGRTIYWNPGPAITVNSETYPAGDNNLDGNREFSPVKTLEKAMELANGGTIIVMQTVDLGSVSAGDYLKQKEGAAWLVKSHSPQFIPTLKGWNITSAPFFSVPSGQELILQDIRLEGPDRDNGSREGLAIVVDGGDLTVRNQVMARDGYIQVTPFPDLKDHPVRADGITNVSVSLFFSEINRDLLYCYTDVVVPTAALLPVDASDTDKTAMGQALMGCYSLATANSLPEAGGGSLFDWQLRPDQAEDDQILNDQNLELYAEYYYPAVYLDGVRGADSATGATCQYPVKSWVRAKEVWEQQVVKTRKERKAAHDAGMAPEAINQKYPYPEKIYICGTVTVADAQIWELPAMLDYDGITPVAAEVEVHKDPAVLQGGGSGRVHAVPEILAEVVTGGSLTIKDIMLRNDSDLNGSQTIKVSGAGAKLTLAGTATLTGTSALVPGESQKEITRGRHVTVMDGAEMVMDATWTGSVEKRQQGISAGGVGTTVHMKKGTTGSIRENNTLGANISGAGVALSGGAEFTMDGGTITGNKTREYGGGVYLAGTGTTFSLNKGMVSGNGVYWMDGGSPSKERSHGIGIYGGSGTVVNIGTADAASTGEAKVCGNKGGLVWGAGIYMEGNSSLNINKAEICDNTGISITTSGPYTAIGLGVYMGSGTLNINGAKIAGNKTDGSVFDGSDVTMVNSARGIGIFTGGGSRAVIENSEISGNMLGVGNWGEESHGTGGGGIATNGDMEIRNTTISGNSNVSGGGIFLERGSLTITDSTLRGNTANSMGGGLCNKGVLRMKDCVVETNKAASGGGIFLNDGEVFANGVQISGNTAVDEGGGYYQGGGKGYLQDLRITGNTAKNGGGMAVSYESSVYWSESASGTSVLSGNTALENGGGIYNKSASPPLSQINFDLKGEIKNSAGRQGSNIYSEAASIELLNGELKQPDTPVEGVYNVYLNSTPGSCSLGLDPQTVTIEKKAGANPDAVYLNAVNSFLRYYQSPLAGADPGSLPVDVNTKAFQAGNVIIRPENKDRIQMYKPNVDLTAAEEYFVTFNAKLTDASLGLGYISGGKMPRRMQAGGINDVADSTLTNVALLGEGVYLAGTASGGSDTNGGTSPLDAVATFEQAKKVLEERITLKNTEEQVLPEEERLGYSPYIYISGNIQVTGNTEWELDYNEPLYTVTNKAFAVSEEASNPAVSAADDILKAQVRRFGSFVSDPMITVEGAGSSLQLGRIMIDGMAEAVYLNPQVNSPVILGGADTTVTLTGDTQVYNNWNHGIQSEGRVVLEGAKGQVNKQLKDIEGVAVELIADGAGVEMRGESGIIWEGSRLPSNVSKGGVGVKAALSDTNQSSIVMKDNSRIEAMTNKVTDGIQAGGIHIQMRDHAQIKNVGNGIVLKAPGKLFSINGNPDAKADDSARIVDCYYGIYMIAGDWEISMNRNSQISGGNTGVAGQTGTTGSYKLEMNDSSALTNGTYGIGAYNLMDSFNLDVVMRDHARIARNIGDGIRMSHYGNRPPDPASMGLTLSMEDNTSISAQRRNGIYLADIYTKRITLKDNAVVGGSSPYVSDSTVEDCGNGIDGLYIEGKAEILLSGNASIRHNQEDGLDLGGGSSATVTMEGGSTISSNGRNGITSSGGRTTEPLKIILKDTASVQNSVQGYEVIVGPDSELHLKDSSRISSNDGIAVSTVCPIYLDGTATVDGPIRLVGKPIILNTPVLPVSKQYNLVLAVEMVAKAVVMPGGTAVTDASVYLSNFVKVQGEGAAADKQLVAASPNIILPGDNKVYLSGAGNDKNDGSSSRQAVRTFHRARELLRTGYYSEGANIAISSEVSIGKWSGPGGESWDNDWSFDEGGTITNEKTGATWKPVVQRADGFVGGSLITIPSETTVVMENITIEGRYGGGEPLVTVNDKNAKLVLGEGAVLQDNGVRWWPSGSPGQPGGVWVRNGTLEMNGGIIQNMVADITNDNVDAEGGMGSAVACVGKNSHFILNSGQIRNNAIKSSTREVTGAAVSIRDGATFTMKGGTLSGNKNITTPPATDNVPKLSRGAALYVVNGRAEISGGTIQNNTASMGSAIYYRGTGSSPETRGISVSGGQITDNLVTPDAGISPEGQYSPVYIGGENFQMAGKGGNITDAIYLAGAAYPITVSGDIRMQDRLYRLYLNQGDGAEQFGKGSVVVRPDGNRSTDVTGYLPLFQVMTGPCILDRGQSPRPLEAGGSVREDQSLLLMRAVFLNGENGDDAGSGQSPGEAVKTFTKASQLGGAVEGGKTDKKDYYVIYICGKTTNTPSETVWTMPSPAYMCRYTGFQVFGQDGSLVGGNPYNGYLIEPQSDLTIQRLVLYGRRYGDPSTHNGDSLIRIPAGVTVTVEAGADGSSVFGRNLNVGQYVNQETGKPSDLSGRGGAFTVEPGGLLDIRAGRITGTEATYGGAVYLGADTIDPAATGRLILRDSPEIEGTVHLGGTGTATAAYAEPQAGYVPAGGKPLNITMENDYNGRECLRYPAGSPPAQVELDYYSFADSIHAIYSVNSRDNASHIVELKQKEAIYLDGERGDDSNSGTTPEQAFKTIRQVYTYIRDQQAGGTQGAEGIVVYVAGTVTLDKNSVQGVVINNHQKRHPDTGRISYEGYYLDAATSQIDIKGQVSYKRYSQPVGYDPLNPIYTGYGRPTFLGALFAIEDGVEMTLIGVSMDGHSRAMESSNPLYMADGVDAQAPLVTVKTGGTLKGDFLGATTGGIISIPVVFQNNRNVNVKTTVAGNLNGVDILEGSSAGIELLGGSAELNNVKFYNLTLGDNVSSGGTDIYHNGEALSVYNQTLFSGTVLLEGAGTPSDTASHATSRFLSVKQAGAPVQESFRLLVRDSYNGRKTVVYDSATGEPSPQEIGFFRLEEQVKEFFYLAQRESDRRVLELRVPSAVYVDGQNGSDSPTDVNAGLTPKTPVRSLKRAYELLKSRGGRYIHVVGAVQIEKDTMLSGTEYRDADGVTITLNTTDNVKLIRYIQPDFARDGSTSADEVERLGYAIEDYTGPLINVTGGSRLSVGANFSLDGHSEVLSGKEYPKEMVVTRTSTSKAPLLTVENNAAADLRDGAVLMNNNNNYTEIDGTAGSDGGGVGNHGTVALSGAAFRNLKAAKGAAAYQAGTFTIERGIENVAGHSFYLASENRGTADIPVWKDSVLRIAQAVPDGLVFNLDMDHASAGRDVIQFTDASAYAPESGADLEHDHFRPGLSVPKDYFLVEAEEDPAVLELQNWKILKAEVPASIYLVVNRKGTLDANTQISGIRVGTQELFDTPEYEVRNNGRYEIQVSVAGLDDQSAAAGITQDAINLKASAAEAVGSQDMYLALKGLDTDPNNGFTVAETALQTGQWASPVRMGQLPPGGIGRFEFTGKVGAGFVNKYKDPGFPITDPVEDVMAYLNGTAPSGKVNARAKFLLKYRVEIVPPRR